MSGDVKKKKKNYLIPLQARTTLGSHFNVLVKFRKATVEFYMYKIYLCIYLATPGPSFSMQYLWLRNANSLLHFPDLGLNPRSLHWSAVF